MKYTAKLTEDGQGLEFTLHYGKEKKSERRTMRVPGDFNDPQGPTPLGFEFVDFAKRAFFEGYRFCAGNYAHMSTVHIKKMLAELEPVRPLVETLDVADAPALILDEPEEEEDLAPEGEDQPGPDELRAVQ